MSSFVIVINRCFLYILLIWTTFAWSAVLDTTNHHIVISDEGFETTIYKRKADGTVYQREYFTVSFVKLVERIVGMGENEIPSNMTTTQLIESSTWSNLSTMAVKNKIQLQERDLNVSMMRILVQNFEMKELTILFIGHFYSHFFQWHWRDHHSYCLCRPAS